MKVDVTQQMRDARGIPLTAAQDGSDDPGVPFRLADLIWQALQDEPPLPNQLPVQVSREEKSRRWRLQNQVYAQSVMDLEQGDEDYILQRAVVQLSSAGFGMLEDALRAAHKDELLAEMAADTATARTNSSESA